jgi:spoIIIJ-associated protein
MSNNQAPIVEFMNTFASALGIKSDVVIEEGPDGARINYTGEESEILVRHRGEPIKALQHVVDMAFGRDLTGADRIFIDALGYRKGKDLELRQMAKFLALKAKETGVEQQLGPLNPYERRLVHMAVSEVPGAATESIGDAFSKTVHISAK